MWLRTAFTGLASDRHTNLERASENYTTVDLYGFGFGDGQTVVAVQVKKGGVRRVWGSVFKDIWG